MSAHPVIRAWRDEPDAEVVMPALFIGHGSPMNAIEDTEFSRAWNEVARSLPRPRAVLCISAHWETSGTRVTAMERPRTIHDFSGFPPELHRTQYPVPGSPELVRTTRELVQNTPVEPDLNWGLDHGAWSVLRPMFPLADVPVVQLSLDRNKSPARHHELGRELQGLRRKGVLILGSGNIVHNLRHMVWEDVAFDWATEFDARIQRWILAGDHDAISNCASSPDAAARLALPTPEHFLPLLYVLGARQESDPVGFFADKVTLGSMSMRSVRMG